MAENLPIYMGDKAIGEFIAFCKKEGFKKFFLIADENTFGVLGKHALQAMESQDWDVEHIVLDPEHLHTNELALTRVLAAYDAQPRLFVAVGSGVITDVTRFTSSRSRNPFVSFPTAASVDAYTSQSSSVAISGMKKSYYCQTPAAIFTDIPTICASPAFLTASGFADSIAKFTSSADWKITHLVWGASFDEAIYQRALGAARRTSGAVEAIKHATTAGMTDLMKSQYESGSCMADFGESAPASGGEHHISHMWDMMLAWAGQERHLHGNTVGVAMVFEARWFERLRALSKADAERLLDQVEIPGREMQEKRIREQVPQIAEEIIAGDPIYMQLSDKHVFEKTRKHLLEHWDEIQSIAANVPDEKQILGWMKMLDAPTTPADLGLSQDQVELALEYGLYLRKRFSMNLLRKLLGW
jgi:glycerol-1-phosphate dehydrogenase [NAD(P)+]